MLTSLHFAHITDVYVSDRGNSGIILDAEAPRLLKDTFSRLNEVEFREGRPEEQTYNGRGTGLMNRLE